MADLRPAVLNDIDRVAQGDRTSASDLPTSLKRNSWQALFAEQEQMVSAGKTQQLASAVCWTRTNGELSIEKVRQPEAK